MIDGFGEPCESINRNAFWTQNKRRSILKKGRPKKLLKKDNLYITLINIFIGMGVSFLLKGSVLAVVLIVIAIGTIIFIERKWIYENSLRSKRHFTFTA